jgi:hypothetical protein
VSLPVFAEETTKSTMIEPAQQNVKAECLLVAVNNCDRGLTPQSRIDFLTNEINKGTAVYSNEELKTLNNELDRANSDLMDAYGGGG